MKIIIILLILGMSAYLIIEIVRIHRLVSISAKLVEHTKKFESPVQTGLRRILVVGDSTGVGVGAPEPAQSIAGRLAFLTKSVIENRAESGAIVGEIHMQLAESREDSYDLILIQGGANDIVQMQRLSETRTMMESILKDAKRKSPRVILITAGKVGDAPLLPRLLAPLYNYRASKLRKEFMRMSEEHGCAYIDLFTASDVFVTDLSKYYAPDYFHPSDDGYAVWFEEIRTTVEAKWPEMVHAQE